MKRKILVFQQLCFKFYFVICTLIGFVSFGLGSIILAYFYLPVVKIFFSKHSNLLMRRAVQWSWWLLISFICSNGTVSVCIKNKHVLDASHGVVVVANHPTLIDIVILISLMPRSTCLVKEALKNNFFMKEVVSAAYIFNSLDPEQMLRDTRNSLQNGNNLVIFPEGSRTVNSSHADSTPELGDANPEAKVNFIQKSSLSRGAARIALNAECNVLPIRLKCSSSFLQKGQKWYDLPNEKVSFELEVREPIVIDRFLKEFPEKQLAARKLTDLIAKELSINNY